MTLGELPEKDWYSILGTAPSDSLTELKKKYQSLVLLYHPDKQSTDVPSGEVEARIYYYYYYYYLTLGWAGKKSLCG
uniref:J domain-containing protein n=1 Tax=Anolis carolinensis TaxID=28377 RepID=G1KXU2_ANOCA